MAKAGTYGYGKVVIDITEQLNSPMPFSELELDEMFKRLIMMIDYTGKKPLFKLDLLTIEVALENTIKEAKLATLATISDEKISELTESIIDEIKAPKGSPILSEETIKDALTKTDIKFTPHLVHLIYNKITSIIKYSKKEVGTPKIEIIIILAKGENLRDYLHKSKTTLSLAQKVEIFKDFLKELNTLHTRYIAHRDLKAENTIYDIKTGEQKIIDFGTSVIEFINSSKKIIPFKWAGTYEAPEVLSNLELKASLQQLQRTDIFAAGQMMWDIFGIDSPLDTAMKNSRIQRKIITLKFGNNQDTFCQSAFGSSLKDYFDFEWDFVPNSDIKNIPLETKNHLRDQVFELYLILTAPDPTKRISLPEAINKLEYLLSELLKEPEEGPDYLEEEFNPAKKIRI